MINASELRYDLRFDAVLVSHTQYIYREREATEFDRPFYPLSDLWSASSRTAHDHHLFVLPPPYTFRNNSFLHKMLVIMLIRRWSTVCNESSSRRKVFHISRFKECVEIFRVCIHKNMIIYYYYYLPCAMCLYLWMNIQVKLDSMSVFNWQ